MSIPPKFQIPRSNPAVNYSQPHHSKTACKSASKLAAAIHSQQATAPDIASQLTKHIIISI